MNINIDGEKIIQAVQVRPVIWDTVHPDYANQAKRKQSWEEIVNIFLPKIASGKEKKEMGDILQKKWKNIRDRYMREFNDRRGRSGDGNRKRTPYIYAQQLAFLQDAVLHKKMLSSRDENQMIEEEIDSQSDSQSTGDEQRQEDDSAGSHQSFGHRMLNPIEAIIIQALDDNISWREMIAKSEEDDDRHFLLSLLPLMKSIPQNFKLTARMEIMACINKYSTYTASVPPQHIHERHSQPSHTHHEQ